MRRAIAALLLAAGSAATAGPAHLFAVTDEGVAIIDGDRLATVRTAPLDAPASAAPAVSSAAAWVATADGHVTRFRLDTLTATAAVQVGGAPRALALADDGRTLAVAVREPPTLVILDATDLTVLATLPGADARGRPSPIAAVATATERGSFLAVLPAIRELWEVPYRPDAAALPVYRGILHDWRRESGEPPPIDERPFPIRRIATEGAGKGLLTGKGEEIVVGGGGGIEVVNLIVGRPIVQIRAAEPMLAGAAAFVRDGRAVVAVPDRRKPVLTLLDREAWRVVATVPTGGPTTVVRTTPAANYLFAVSPEAGEDRVLVVDREALEVVEVLRPFPGRTIAALALSPDGDGLFVAAAGSGGGVVRYATGDLSPTQRNDALRIEALLPLDAPRSP